jgi:hypothetical protein
MTSLMSASKMKWGYHDGPLFFRCITIRFFYFLVWMIFISIALSGGFVTGGFSLCRADLIADGKFGYMKIYFDSEVILDVSC